MFLALRSRSVLVELFAVGILSSVVACGNDSGQVDQGQQAVKARACASCHQGTDGSLSGQTMPQPMTSAYPPNLTPDMDTGIGSWTTDQIVAAILTGVDDEGAHLCSTMPKFGMQGMTEDEAKNIAAYLKSLAPVHSEIPESMCPEKGGDATGGAGGASTGGAAGK
jgi:mono/diheme cytochrome c family protein